MKEVRRPEPPPGVKEGSIWGRKVKQGVKKVGVKEVKEGPINGRKTLVSDFFLLSPPVAEIRHLNFFLSFTPTPTLALQARVRVSPRVTGGERRKKA